MLSGFGHGFLDTALLNKFYPGDLQTQGPGKKIKDLLDTGYFIAYVKVKEPDNSYSETLMGLKLADATQVEWLNAVI